jgi:hypothetical protein
MGSPDEMRPVCHCVRALIEVSSLAHHLGCKYEAPVFLASSWYSTVDATSNKKGGWFVAHASGASFRSLDLPVVMTRKMEHIFVASHDHLAIEHAIRRAEPLALGAPAAFVQAVLSTRLATDLSNGMFWRTVWSFLIANAGILDPKEIAPMIDFIQAIRHNRVAVETPDNQQEITVKGAHFLQEDAPSEVGEATARFAAKVFAGQLPTPVAKKYDQGCTIG